MHEGYFGEDGTRVGSGVSGVILRGVAEIDQMREIFV